MKVVGPVMPINFRLILFRWQTNEKKIPFHFGHSKHANVECEWRNPNERKSNENVLWIHIFIEFSNAWIPILPIIIIYLSTPPRLFPFVLLWYCFWIKKTRIAIDYGCLRILYNVCILETTSLFIYPTRLLTPNNWNESKNNADKNKKNEPKFVPFVCYSFCDLNDIKHGINLCSQ